MADATFTVDFTGFILTAECGGMSSLTAKTGGIWSKNLKLKYKEKRSVGERLVLFLSVSPKLDHSGCFPRCVVFAYQYRGTPSAPLWPPDLWPPDLWPLRLHLLPHSSSSSPPWLSPWAKALWTAARRSPLAELPRCRNSRRLPRGRREARRAPRSWRRPKTKGVSRILCRGRRRAQWGPPVLMGPP